MTNDSAGEICRDWDSATLLLQKRHTFKLGSVTSTEYNSCLPCSGAPREESG
jgi:hypothetical protein